MYYQLHESELNKIEMVRLQLTLISNLCEAVPNNARECVSADALHSLTVVHQDALQDLQRAIEQRFEDQRAVASRGGAMAWFDWLDALQIAAGDTRLVRGGATERVTDKLTLAAQIDPEVQPLRDVWLTIVARAERQRAPAPDAADKPSRRRRDRKAAP